MTTKEDNMQIVRHHAVPPVDDQEDGLDTDLALLFGSPSGRERSRPSRNRMLTGALVLALSLVAGAWILVSLAEMGWRLLPW